MATIFNNVIVAELDENGQFDPKSGIDAKIDMSRQGDGVVLCIYKGKTVFCFNDQLIFFFLLHNGQT